MGEEYWRYGEGDDVSGGLVQGPVDLDHGRWHGTWPRLWRFDLRNWARICFWLAAAGVRSRKLRATFVAKGARAAFASADIRDFAAVEQSLAAAEKEFGRPFGGIDTLVNNAAGNFIARTEKLSPNAFNAVVGIVLQGTFHFTLALGRKWIAAKKPGNILNIVTTYAATNAGSGFVVPSACAKAGVLALDALAGSGVGEASHSPECHSARSVPD